MTYSKTTCCLWSCIELHSKATLNAKVNHVRNVPPQNTTDIFLRTATQLLLAMSRLLARNRSALKYIQPDKSAELCGQKKKIQRVCTFSLGWEQDHQEAALQGLPYTVRPHWTQLLLFIFGNMLPLPHGNTVLRNNCECVIAPQQKIVVEKRSVNDQRSFTDDSDVSTQCNHAPKGNARLNIFACRRLQLHHNGTVKCVYYGITALKPHKRRSWTW